MTTIQVKKSSIQYIEVSQLYPHPDNRPLGINEEKVEQLAEMMRQTGYDESKPIKARPYPGAHENGYPGFQIIEGEHRWRAAQAAGIDKVPVFVVEVDDKQALVELDTGNEQTPNDKLSVGLMALNFINSGHGTLKDYAKLTSRQRKYDALKSWHKASIVFRLLESEMGDVSHFFNETQLLFEINKCSEFDWVWCAGLCVKQNLSFREFQEISRRIRAIDAAAGDHAASILDLTAIKQEVATAKEKVFKDRLSLIEGIEEAVSAMPESVELWKYDLSSKQVISYEYKPGQMLIERIKDTADLTRQKVFAHQKSVLDILRHQTKEQAENDKEYYEDKANAAAKEAAEKAEWEAFIPERGKWYKVGQHRLYCGDNRDKAFINALPKDAAFAFADPPYNAGADEWDHGFTWGQDYLCDHAEIVAVTPGIGNIPALFQNSKMPYKWSLSTWIKNGMTRGALGFGNWIYTAIFSRNESIHQNDQDFSSVTVKTSDSEDHYHRGKKPPEYMDWIINKFTKHGQSVIDPFGGSGSTLLSCERNGRVCYMAEISPEYCKEIIRQFKELGSGN